MIERPVKVEEWEHGEVWVLSHEDGFCVEVEDLDQGDELVAVINGYPKALDLLARLLVPSGSEIYDEVAEFLDARNVEVKR